MIIRSFFFLFFIFFLSSSFYTLPSKANALDKSIGTFSDRSDRQEFYLLEHRLRELFLKKRLEGKGRAICRNSAKSHHQGARCGWEKRKREALDSLIQEVEQKRELFRGFVKDAIKCRKGGSFPDVPHVELFSLDEPWRHHVDDLLIQEKHLNQEVRGPDEKIYNAVFTFFNSEAKSTRLQLINKLSSFEKTRATLQCDGPWQFKFAVFGRKNLSPQEEKKFYWPFEQKLARLVLDSSVQKCVLTIQNIREEEETEPHRDENGDNPSLSYSFLLQFKQEPSSNLAHFCLLPSAKRESALRQLFLSDSFSSYSCPVGINKITPLPGLTESLNARVQALLGKELPQEMIEQGNPYYPLDFTQAPKLKYILIATYTLAKDFYGTVLRRLLSYHLERGTPVYFMTSHATSSLWVGGKQAREMLEEMESNFENFHVQFYQYRGNPIIPVDRFRQFHRTNHTKIFITVPQASQEEQKEDERGKKGLVIVGGRNVKDTYVFEKTPDLSSFPELFQHMTAKRYWWTDMDIMSSHKMFVSIMAQHYFTLWNHDRKNFLIRSFNTSLSTDAPLKPNYFSKDKIHVRHLLSSPYSDGMSLESFYVQLVDSAQKNIYIVVPYLNLTLNLRKAFERAVQRGVDIQVITYLNAGEDPIGIIAGCE